MRSKAPPEASNASVEGQAFQALYNETAASMIRLAALLVDDRQSAEDVVHDAFTALFENWHTLSDPSKATAYLRRSVVNGARSTLRRRRTARSWIAPRAVHEPSAEELALLDAEHAEVIMSLAKLSERQREVLVLRYWSELSEADIANTLQIPQGTVKSTAHRALRALEGHLKKSERSRVVRSRP